MVEQRPDNAFPQREMQAVLLHGKARGGQTGSLAEAAVHQPGQGGHGMLLHVHRVGCDHCCVGLHPAAPGRLMNHQIATPSTPPKLPHRPGQNR